MTEFTVTALGVGDSFSEFNHSSALLLSCDGFHLGIDCPDMYRSVLRSASQKGAGPLDITEIDHMLITHVHGDHMNGLEGFAFFKHFAENKRLKLVASNEVREVIWDQRLVASMGQLFDGTQMNAKHFDDYFEFMPLEWQGSLQVGPFSLEARQTKHHVVTSALRITAGDASFAYSSDTAFDPTLIDFLAPADLIIHETNYGPAHTAYEDLAALPQTLRSKMRLIHYADTFDVDASNIEVVTEGQVLVVKGGLS